MGTSSGAYELNHVWARPSTHIILPR